MERTNRDTRLDIIKGVAICMVVVGHVISGVYQPERYIYNPIFKFCYSFHMPLFILVSGWLMGLKDISKAGIDWLVKRTNRLLVPYIIWTCLKWIIIPCDNNLFVTITAVPLYWYLIVLYLCTLISFIASRFKKKYFVSILLYLFFVTLAIIVGGSNMILKRMMIYFPFYFAGYLLSSKSNSIGKFMTYRYLWPGALLYPLSMMSYTYSDYGEIISKIQRFTGVDNVKLIKAGVMFYNHYIVAALGIMFAWCIVSFICDKKILSGIQKILSYIGLYTLQIYILHDMLFIKIFENTMINSLLSVVTGLLGSMLIAVIIQKSNRINKILFG